MRKLKTWIAIAITVAILLGIAHKAMAPPMVYKIEYSFYADYTKMMHKISVLNAIISVESGNIGSKAFNKKENAAGILQIRPIYVKEVNKYSEYKFTLSDRFDIEKSIMMFFILNDTLNPDYELDYTAHCHNAGYYNTSKRYHKTTKYRRKVYEAFENNNHAYTNICMELFLWSDKGI